MTALACVSGSLAFAATPCSFCEAKILQNQKIYEDDHVIVLYDYKPAIEGHCLVIPKRHVEHLQDLNSDEILAVHGAVSKLFEAAQKTYDATAYLIFQKNGVEAGQSVPHVHVHFLPRKPNDYSDIGIYARLFFLKFKSPLTQDQIDIHRNNLAQHFLENQDSILAL